LCLISKVCGRDILEKLMVTRRLNKFLTFYGIRRFNTVLVTAHYWSPSWARWIRCIPFYPIYFRSIFSIIHLRLCLRNVFFFFSLLDLLFVHISHVSRVYHKPHPFHPPWFYHIHNNHTFLLMFLSLQSLQTVYYIMFLNQTFVVALRCN
jgi:hypothetical protein